MVGSKRSWDLFLLQIVMDLDLWTTRLFPRGVIPLAQF